ncbi:alpha/beta hydrolase [Telmatospirillum sp.]|uniref:alpha/beta hydrolase n=1 Tax=Telmatospirillum sp. TaxID=2079197 RepID=UPI00283EE398|nr:alpha/beta hydrolase [Telmatospirillum sp.]MDR3436264.1 alpha/beta hydrolase [Telmatospirillum sp.]
MAKAKMLFWGGIVASLLMSSVVANAESIKTQSVINLWPADGVGPGSQGSPAQLTVTERSKVPFWPDRVVTGITRPNLTAFVPDRPNGVAVIAAPGGAYGRIVLDKEAAEMARWLNPYGVTVFLLQYRLPGEGHANGADVPLQDGQRAIRVVRQHAKEWGLDPNRIGLLGASAAGHLAASVGAEFDKKVYEAQDDADKLSARPDFLLLLYPVVTMETGYTHLETRDNLLGKDPSAERIAAYSPDLHITKDSPKTFIVLADDDPFVPSENAIRYFQGLKKVGVQAELHIFKDGGHGFGIRDTRQLPVSAWPNLAIDWMKSNGILK